jgi:ADP-heptose:LPS heptosyltransferase
MKSSRLFRWIDRLAGAVLMVALRVLGWVLPVALKGGDAVLVVKFSAMGDTVLLLPVIRRLRAAHPGRRICGLGTFVNRDALRASPDLDEVIVFEPGMVANPLRLASFIRELRARRFGLALDFDQWLRISPILCFVSGAPRRAGFATPGQFRHLLYTDPVARAPGKHERDLFFDVLARVGVEASAGERATFFPVDGASRGEAERFLRESGVEGRYAVIHPGCGARGWRRQWPEERYGELVRWLGDRGLGVLVSTGPGEEGLGEAIARISGRDPVMVAGKPLAVLASIMEKASVFVSGNTGVMHLAAAAGAPVVALHGPTDAGRWGPVGKRCISVSSRHPGSPCLDLGFEYRCKDPGRKCMEEIGMAEVIAAVEALLKNGAN